MILKESTQLLGGFSKLEKRIRVHSYVRLGKLGKKQIFRKFQINLRMIDRQKCIPINAFFEHVFVRVQKVHI